jgi:hypothetical protein
MECASRFLERETGIEPATNGLGSRYSTIELLPPATGKCTKSGRLELRIAATNNYLASLKTCRSDPRVR